MEHREADRRIRVPDRVCYSRCKRRQFKGKLSRGFNVTSNTATVATFIPILGGVAVGIGADPMSLLIPAAFAATCAFMLPVGTPPNAIVFSTGAVTIAQMARGGFVLNLVGILLITLLCYFIGGATLGLKF